MPEPFPVDGIRVPAVAPIRRAEGPARSNIKPLESPSSPTPPSTSSSHPVANGPKNKFPIRLKRRSVFDGRLRDGTYVDYMSVDVDAGRVLLWSPYDYPVRGDVDTDLEPGRYLIQAQPKEMKFVFFSGDATPTKPGLRFELWLDGADPWALQWPEGQFTLLALRGFRPQPQTMSFTTAVSQIKQFADDGQPSAAYRALHTLPLVNLYDAADELAMRDRDEGGTNVVMSLVHSFKGAAIQALEDEGGDSAERVLQALEAMCVPFVKSSVDEFRSWAIDMDTTLHADEARAQQGLHTMRLVFTYWDLLERKLFLWGDDIFDTDWTDNLPLEWGPLALRYPRRFTAATTPKIVQAAKEAKQAIADWNFEKARRDWEQTWRLLNYCFVGIGIIVFGPGSAASRAAAAVGASGAAGTAIARRRAAMMTAKSIGEEAAELLAKRATQGELPRLESVPIVRATRAPFSLRLPPNFKGSTPGTWIRPFGGKMSEPAARFQSLASDGCPRDWEVIINNVRFDHQLPDMLIEAKYFHPHGDWTQAFVKMYASPTGTFTAGEHLVLQRIAEQGTRQFNAAIVNGVRVPILWRVSNQLAADHIQWAFKMANLPIKVVHFAP